MLTALTQAGLKVKTSDYPGVPTFLRNHFMSRAKLVLSLQHDKEWMTVNPYRILYAVQNHCCMVVEKQQHDMDGYSDYGTPVETENLVEYCMELIRSGHYQTVQTKKRVGIVANPMKLTFGKIFL